MNKTNRKELAIFLGVLILLTLIIMPWRNSVSQDDSAYAYSAVSLAKGNQELHPGNVAMIYPQLAVGYLAIKALPLAEISALNFGTWICFLIFVAIAFTLFRLPATIMLSFFLFPIWIQYGSSYLSETYSALIFICLIFAITRIQNPALQYGGAFVLSSLLGTQIQNMAAFPFFWGTAFLISKDKSRRPLGLILVVGSLISLVSFLLMKKTPFQQGYGYWLAQVWIEYGTTAIHMAFAFSLHLFVSMGMFLIPLVSISKLTRHQVLVGILFQLFYILYNWGTGMRAMPVGVFYISQFSAMLSYIFISFGIWGWIAVWQSSKNKESQLDLALPLVGSIAAIIAVFVFSVFRHAFDIRYVMTWTLVILFHIRPVIQIDFHKVIGSKVAFVIFSFVMTVVLNLYSMNTTEARWQVAADLESKGVPKDQISAGIGRDSYELEAKCINLIMQKLEAQAGAEAWKTPDFNRRIITQYNRSHADEWTPSYIIKPSMAMGFSFKLKQHTLPGQENEPQSYYDYSVLGIKSQLAVFHNQNSQAAWCFR